MAQTTIPGGFYVPTPYPQTSGPTLQAHSNVGLNTSNTHTAYIFTVPKSGVLDKFETYLTNWTVTVDIRVSFQDVNASMFPDLGVDQYRVIPYTQYAANNPCWFVPGLITNNGTDGGTKRTVTKGQLLAAVFDWGASTAAGGTTHGGLLFANTFQFYLQYPMLCTRLSSFTRRPVSEYTSMVLKYDDGTYERIGDPNFPALSVTSTTFSSASTPDERALYFKFPVPVTIDGGFYLFDLNSDCDIVLYDTDGTSVLATVAIDFDSTAASSPGYRHFRFSTEIPLEADGWYRLSLKAGASTSLTGYEFNTNSAAIMAACEAGGWCLSTRTDAGSWTETTTARPFAGVRVIKLESEIPEVVPVGSGNSLITFIATDYAAPAANYATPDRRNGHPVLDFDDTTQEYAYFSGVLPRHYSNGGITATICWTATSASSGTCTWGLSFERDDATLDSDSDSFASAVTGGSVAPATVGAFKYLAIALTDAQLDGLAVGEHFRLKVTRSTGGISGDAELHSIELRET